MRNRLALKEYSERKLDLRIMVLGKVLITKI